MNKSTLLKSLFCCAALFLSLEAKLQIITTFTGNIYIVDNENLRIRKVDAITRIITTIAGNGSGGISGDGGLAINANIQDPLGVAVDASGNNLYITTGIVGRIRKVNLLTGIIT